MTDHARAMLEDNLEALGLGGLTVLKLRDAVPRGRYVRLPDGSPALELDGKILDRPADPRAQEELVQAIDGAGQDVVLLFGIGAGHLARALRERTRAHVVIYEPDPGLLRTLLEAGPCDLGGAPIVSDVNDLKAVWARYARSRPVATTVQTPGYAEAFPEAFQEIAKSVREMLSDEQCVENTRRVRFRQWVDNLIANLPVVQGTVPITALADRFKGMPAFIVGAGPSLDKNADLLREAARHGLVIAVNSSASALAAREITPHAVVCIESIDLSAKLSALPFLDDVTRIFSLSSHPNNLRSGKGPLMPTIEKLPAFENVGELLRGPGAEVGGSVSTVAFWLARTLGCSPLVLVGQDLAFTGYGTYARGTTYEESRAVPTADGKALDFVWSDAIKKAHGTAAGPMIDRADLVMVDAWGGEGQVPSGVMFASFRAWFEVAAAVFAVTNPELELVNATEGGSRLRGFKEERLADVLARTPRLDRSPGDAFADARRAASPIEPEALFAWTERQARLARGAARAARRVGLCAEKAQKQLGGDGSPDAIRRAFDALGRAEALLKSACKDQPLVEGLAYAEVQTRMEPAAAADMSDAREAADRSLREEIALAATLVKNASSLERALRDVSRTHHQEHLERKGHHAHRHADERCVASGATKPDP